MCKLYLPIFTKTQIRVGHTNGTHKYLPILTKGQVRVGHTNGTHRSSKHRETTKDMARPKGKPQGQPIRLNRAAHPEVKPCTYRYPKLCSNITTIYQKHRYQYGSMMFYNSRGILL